MAAPAIGEDRAPIAGRLDARSWLEISMARAGDTRGSAPIAGRLAEGSSLEVGTA
jgi:hypothetical protein